MLITSDFTTSMHRALAEIDPHYITYPGIVICGTHEPRDVERRIEMVAQCRATGTPLLGVCHGYHIAAIEYARNVLNIKDATSEEWSTEGTFVVKKRPELKVGLKDGESWWSNYHVDIDFDVPENFFITPYHPEYQSWKKHKHPVLVNFLHYAKMAM